MASNPPFNVEDQTDEDFFDKLVNDDDFEVTASTSALSFIDGNDSDEIKAFANLSIDDVGTMLDDSGGAGGIEPKVQAALNVDKPVSPDLQIEENSSLALSNSLGCESLIESNTGNAAADIISQLTSKNIGSSNSSVKELQWSAFGVDSTCNGFGSYSDFFTELGDGAADSIGNVGSNLNIESKVSSENEAGSSYFENSNHFVEAGEGHTHGVLTEQILGSHEWENLYPGWKYDQNTGQWYQVDGYDATKNVQRNANSNLADECGVFDEKLKVSYLQQTAHSAAGTALDSGTTESITNWSQVSQATGNSWSQVSQATGNSWSQVSQGNEYPSHMVFDPQYPDWYFDTITQEWRSLDTYTPSIQAAGQARNQLNQNELAANNTFHHESDKNAYGQCTNIGTEGLSSQRHGYNWSGSFSSHNNLGSNMWESTALQEINRNHQLENPYGQSLSTSNRTSQSKSYHNGDTVSFYEITGQGRNEASMIPGPQGLVAGSKFIQQYNQPKIGQDEHKHVTDDFCADQNSGQFSHQPLLSAHQFSYAPAAGRSSDGRPPHALVSFGFGGKLIVMKDASASSFGSQDPVGGSISVLNLTEVVMGNADASGIGAGACNYFHALCRQSYPGPLIGGSLGNKELNKWIDERIIQCESPDNGYRRGEVLRLLLSVLKIACQHYGKLRSAYASETAFKETDSPESAVARLFASAKRNGVQFSDYNTISHCLHKLPSEGHMQATAVEVQTLLISGRKKEALQCAQQGQLWGPALVLAAQLGDQFYADTVKQMALRQIVAGSPLRTLCLLIAGQPADVFSTDTTSNIGVPGALSIPQQSLQIGANDMLDDWEENLAVIAANRTKDDELVLIHLGDCLWKERNDIIAAHICYLVAETNFEAYSNIARMCLVGADHWKFPRTYACPEAIQRTEVYEYSKVLGNSQFFLLPFQPYKILYAHMLAEVGSVSNSLKYCQAVTKSLKTSRAPEVDTWRQLVSALEERIKTHQQGGFSSKLVDKLLNLFDTTAHRVVGGLPPPAPTILAGPVQSIGLHNQSSGPRVSTSQSTMAISSLIPSASMEPISAWAADDNRKAMHNRSVSEPDFGRTPIQDKVDTKDAISSNVQGASRFGGFSFGSQLLQKTVGLVLKPRQEKQAKLGEKNKFYYDEKLKRWVEEGADSPAEETPLPPPPTAAFPNGTVDCNLANVLKSGRTSAGGIQEYRSTTIPPLPPATNQFSARGRMGVRSRYVDTFNQGGGDSTNLFHSPSVPSIKLAGTANPKFFVPAPAASSVEHPLEHTGDSLQASATDKNPSVSTVKDTFLSPASSSPMTMQRFASDDNISKRGIRGNGPLTSLSRRTASWGGSPGEAFSPPNRDDLQPVGEVLGMSSSSFVPNNPSLLHSSMNACSSGDDLHDVDL